RPGRFDLAGDPTDRQTVASWFESSGGKPRVADSVGQPAPPAWAQTLPMGLEVGPSEAVDEFGRPPGAQPSQRGPGQSAGMAASGVVGATVGPGDRRAIGEETADHPRAEPALRGPGAAGAVASSFAAGGNRADSGGPRSPSREALDSPLKAIQVH